MIQALFLKKIQHFIASVENNSSPFLFDLIISTLRNVAAGLVGACTGCKSFEDVTELKFKRGRGEFIHIKSAAADPPRSSFNTMPTTLRSLSRSLCRTRTRRRCARSVCPTRKSTHRRTISPSTHVFLQLQRSSLYARTLVCVCVRALLVTKESRMTDFCVSCVFSDTPSRTDGRRCRRSRAPHSTGSAEP